MATDDSIGTLSAPELQVLWTTARQRLERNGRAITSSPMNLTDLSDAEVASLCALLARRRPPTNTVRVSLAELDAALRASRFGLGLIDALQATGGPVVDRRAQRTAHRDRVADLWKLADSHPAAESDDVAQWLSSVRRRGRLTRIGADDPADILTNALDFLLRLRLQLHEASTEPRPLAAIAADTFGDAHALDAETPLGSLVVDAVLALSGAADLRSAWRSFGVDLDNVSSSALCFMIPGGTGSILQAGCTRAEPLRITGRMLDRGLDLDIREGTMVSVCENPSIVMAAADRLGAACGPLVCVEGMPSSVTSRLLVQLRQQGANLRVHADFDFGGIAITNHVISRHNAAPWLMSQGDYIAALEGASTTLDRSIGPTLWDPGLTLVMNARRRAVHEEAVADTLIASLTT